MLFYIQPVNINTVTLQAAMETLPAGWTVYTCEQERAETGLLKGESDDTKANTHIQDLFHEDAKARCSVCQLKWNNL